MPDKDGFSDIEKRYIRNPYDLEEDFDYPATDPSRSLQAALANKSRLEKLRKQHPKAFYGTLVLLFLLFAHFLAAPVGITRLVNNQMDVVSETYAKAIKDRKVCAQRATQQLGLKATGSPARTPVTDAITGRYGAPIMMERIHFFKELGQAYPGQTLPGDARLRAVNKNTLQGCFEVFQRREADINVTVKDLVANKSDWIVHQYGPKQYPNSRLTLEFDNGLPPLTGNQALAYLTTKAGGSWTYRSTAVINTAHFKTP